MDGFSYHNIFATKGIEYVAIVGFFAILIPFWLILNKQVKLKQIQRTLGNLAAASIKIPQGIFFSRFHTWTYLERTGYAKVGMDDLLLHITGEVKFKYLANSGENVKKGDLLAEIYQDEKVLQIYSPISGQIVDSNSMVVSNPEIMNEDPYSKGWIYKMKPSSWVADTNSYYLADDATSWSKQELERFKDFLAISLGKYSPDPTCVVLQDGGEMRDQPLSEMPVEVWQDFQHDFLNTKIMSKKPSCFKAKED